MLSFTSMLSSSSFVRLYLSLLLVRAELFMDLNCWLRLKLKVELNSDRGFSLNFSIKSSISGYNLEEKVGTRVLFSMDCCSLSLWDS